MANSPARVPVDVGSVIADTYKIEALLGRGGMGAVFLASHLRLAGKQVAIKILHTEIEDVDVIARFKREAEIAARLNHPNIVGVVDYNVAADGTPYLVLDYLEGETLAQRIARGPLALDHVMSILRQVGSALAAAHRAGIVHRDLKPQNIFLVPTEVDGRLVEIAKVLDFGISKIRGSQTVKTQDSALLGTPQYMAPEQATGQHAAVDERTDVFALGAIVYEMLSGQPAFSGASIPEVVFKVVYEQPAPLTVPLPPPVGAAVGRAMAKPADERFPTVAAFVEAVTGQPLTLSRGQVPPAPAANDSPSALRRAASREAFAQTMGSGDHGDSPIAHAGATAAGGAAHTAWAPGTAPGAAGNAAATGAAATLPPSTSRSTASVVPGDDRGAPRRRSAGTVVAIALAGAAVAAGAVYIVTRGPSSSTAHRPDVAMLDPSTDRARGEPAAAAAPPGAPAAPPVAAAAAAAPPAVAAAAPPAAEPVAGGPPAVAAAASGSAVAVAETTPAAGSSGTKIADSGAATRLAQATGAGGKAETGGAATRTSGGAKPAKGAKPAGAGSVALADADTDPAAKNAGAHRDQATRPAGAHAAVPTAGAADAEGDEDVREKLRQASSALDAHDYDLAEKLANAVINSSATPKQRASARLIHGTVQCVARNDQEAAQIDLRNLAGFHAMRAKLLAACRSHGILNGP